MLDSTMAYTCGYWKHAKTLKESQIAKHDLICRKLGIKEGDRVLDIGCGWGGFAEHAAKEYGASVVGLTISKEQQALARERVRGLPVEIRLQDYRDVNDGPYDHVVSIGMFEHVGYKNYRQYMQVVRKVLKEDGLFLLHCIGNNRTAWRADPWFDKYIFPNGYLASPRLIGKAIDGIFVMEDWHTFGADYEPTLLAWFKNFDEAWPEFSEKYGGEIFYRMWKYYLLTMAGAFRSRYLNLWQIVLSPKGVKGGYISIR
jgi:cyclopropane-fatty-acyl-phospholipid synthase